ncbi:hypothetical protein PCANC_28683 [Puccinia coronata f. sp. avenae]|uniref:Uncharacterized protein n=1 Tax=Puccinia coronata f. sp. avenae TaxID=200324 RepID=A0A2N5RTR2_9BASI|nr:hypothetical protein PCANC_28683 [Puccinia coronata f. sp. avenae]
MLHGIHCNRNKWGKQPKGGVQQRSEDLERKSCGVVIMPQSRVLGNPVRGIVPTSQPMQVCTSSPQPANVSLHVFIMHCTYKLWGSEPAPNGRTVTTLPISHPPVLALRAAPLLLVHLATTLVAGITDSPGPSKKLLRGLKSLAEAVAESKFNKPTDPGKLDPRFPLWLELRER